MSCAYFTEFASFANFWATARGLMNTLAYFGLGGLVAALFGRDLSRPWSCQADNCKGPGGKPPQAKAATSGVPGAAAALGCHVAALESRSGIS